MMMKHIRFFSLLLMLLTAMTVTSQEVNKLYIKDVSCMIGRSVDLLFYVENTHAGITALQADVFLPEKVSLETVSSYRLLDEDRTVDHRIRVEKRSRNNVDYYRILMVSTTNRPILANKGQLFSLRATIADDAPLEAGETYPIQLQGVILSDTVGHNVVTAYDGGSITIAPSPDFTVSNVQLTAVNDQTGVTTLNPGDNFTLEWTVNNIGTVKSDAGWSEQIVLVSTATNERCLVAISRHVDERLESGASLSVSEKFTVPRIPGLDGSFKVQVELVPNKESGEHIGYQNNNTTVSSSSYTMGKSLFLTLQRSDIAEPGHGYQNRYYVTLERSGSRLQAQTFNVSLTPADSRLTLEDNSVTISQKNSSSSFGFLVTDDDLLNGTLEDIVDFTITAAAANGYVAASVTGHLIDDEHPDLQATLSKTLIDEGDELTLTVTATRVPQSDLKVQLTNNASSRFKMPSSVTIPAGTASASTTIKAYDDNVVADTVAVRFTASATGYNNGHADAFLSDNDMPQLTLTLSSSTVSEGAGANAVACVLKRDKTNAPLTVYVSTSNESLVYGNYRIFTMAKGQSQYKFYLHVIDNSMVEDDREVTLRVAAYYSSCSCQTTGKVGGTAEKTLTVVDDDGPTLSLTTTMPNILEGSIGNMFTVSRNNETTSPLTVTLSTLGNHPDMQFPALVTIPAGESSTTFEVGVDQNSQNGDSRTITLVAKSDGYARGSCLVMVTDQTLADATIEMSVESSQVYATVPAAVRLTVHNYGYAPLPKKTPISIVVDGRAVETIYTKSALGAGEISVMPIVATAVLSDKPRQVSVYAVVNDGGENPEINYANNASPTVTVNVLPLLEATQVETYEDDYQSEETVHISGETTGMVNHEADLEVYIVQGGTRIALQTKTDEEGRFAVDWTPSLGMAGSFGIGACMPGEDLTRSLKDIYVYGMRRAGGTFLANEMEVGESQNGYIDIVNPGTRTLRNVQTTIVSCPDNVTLTFEEVGNLVPGQTKQMTYHLTGLGVSPSFKEWQTAQLRITSAEGAVMLQTINFVIYPSVPQLKSTVSSINTTMVIDTLRTYEFTIYNEGRKETGEITVDVGNTAWLTTATPRRMASLASGEAATVVLQMRPTSDMEANSVWQGGIFISAANGGNDLSIPMRVECVSEKTGTLMVDVWDEFTANTEEAPHVSGATVAVLHPVTQKLLRQDVTGESGIVTFEYLPEGQYLLKVTHPKHDSYLETVMVSPARTTSQRAFITYSAITIEMVYEPTEVEDVYDITTVVNYETQVPAPVVKMDMPEKLLVEELQTPYIYYVTLTNVGLLTAKNVEFETETEWGDYRFTPLIEGPWNILPQQSVIIPVEITKVSDGTAQARGAWGPGRRKLGKTGTECALGAMSKWKGSCAGLANSDDSQEYMAKQLMQVNDGCAVVSDVVNLINNVLSSFGFRPSGGGWTSKTPKASNFSKTPSGKGVTHVSCDPCLYDNADDYIDAVQDMKWRKKGGKLRMAKGTARLLKPCPNGTPPPGWPREGGMESRQQTRGTKVLYNIIPDSMSNASLMDCYREIVKVITPVEADVIEIPGLVITTDALVEIPSWHPSYLRAWLTNTGIAHDLNYHDMGYIYYVMGNTKYPLIETEEAQALVSAFQAAIWPTDEQIAALHPEALNDEQYAAVVDRLRNFNTQQFNLLDSLAERVQADRMELNRLGYYDAQELCETEADKALEGLNTNQTSSCASVKLQMSQQLTMTRQAVRGTLTVVNGAQTGDMTDVKLNLVVTDPYGNVATSHLMEIHTESITGFEGEADFESGWTLGAGKTGEAKIIFIPTKYAAPTEPLLYTFAGTISFVDPFTGQEMTRELETERLTVAPSPNLELTYFMQRDIMGDDPLTDEVEPVVPSQFTLLINNKGYGDATKVKMVTRQPEIIDNEKGLLADYEIISSQLNGGEKTLALGSSVTTDFGDIPAHSQAYAQWWLASSLTGHFTDYAVEATHVTSYDNPDLTLLDTVTIHELIHQIVIPGGEDKQPPLIGFLANDVQDADDTADQLYKSDGTQQPIYHVASAEAVKRSDTEYLVNVLVNSAGWNYGQLADPTGGSRKLLTVRRQSDLTLLPAENFWQTDRTLRDGLQPLYENLIHFCDTMGANGDAYVVTFEDKPSVELSVVTVSGVPSSGTFTRDSVGEVVVTFNKAIDAATFTTADLALMLEGEAIDLSGVTVEPIDVGNVTTFRFDLSSKTTLDGLYCLDIRLDSINDLEGFHGESGKKCSWIQISDGMANLILKVSPEGSGTVSPGTGKLKYDSLVTVSASPLTGYEFGRWVKDDAMISETATFAYQMAGPATLTAIFIPNQYKVIVNYNQDGGTVDGGSGLYDYNQPLTFTARPKKGYYFAGWKCGDETVSTNPQLSINVSGAVTYSAEFEQLNFVQADLLDTSDDNVTVFANPASKKFHVTMNRKLSQNQWNTFCVPFDISEQQINKVWGYNTMLVRFKSMEGETLNFEYAWNIKAGVPYLVKPERTVVQPELDFNGNLVLSEKPKADTYNNTHNDDYSFVGIYSPRAWENIGTEYYYGVSSGKLVKAKSNSSALNGMRAYFVLPANAYNARLSIQGIETMGIDSEALIDGRALGGPQRIYNLQGQRVNSDERSLPAGIYIVNGKKQVIR
ncbi:MAG: InlB B-repeat-containing protein [Prevotella sp.]|nr:InlB B-repeat-containing protein [Prevotella sp.]